MTAVVIDSERIIARPGGSTPALGVPRRPATLAIAAALAGLAVVAIAMFGLTSASSPTHDTTVIEPAVALPTWPDVGVAQITYDPGHASGWHVHSGVHSVVVLSGTLTVYDQECRRHDFSTGETYLGGNEPHLAVNEGPTAAELAVTYVYTTKADPGRTLLPPAGCVVR